MASKLLNITPAAPVQAEVEKKAPAKKTKESKQVAKKVSKKDAKKQQKNAALASSVVRRGGDYYHNGKYMSDQAYKNLLKNTCPEAFDIYKGSKGLIGTGWSFFVLGPVIACGAGLPIWLYAYTKENLLYQVPSGQKINGEKLMTTVGITCVVVGSTMFTLSIPIMSAGYAKRKKSMMVYNTNCEPPVTYNITAGQNGIGLAINF